MLWQLWLKSPGLFELNTMTGTDGWVYEAAHLRYVCGRCNGDVRIVEYALACRLSGAGGPLCDIAKPRGYCMDSGAVNV
jgi:hypothetical protein